jgi:hypothetical protein
MTIPEVSITAQRLYERLATAKPEDIVTYEELVTLTGAPLIRIRGPLRTARKMAHQFDNLVFAPLRGIGLKACPDTVKVNIGSDLRPIRRAIKRKARILGAVTDYDKLPAEAKTRHQAGMVVLGTLDLMTTPTKVKQVAATMGAKGPLSIGDTLKLFGPKKTDV